MSFVRWYRGYVHTRLIRYRYRKMSVMDALDVAWKRDESAVSQNAIHTYTRTHHHENHHHHPFASSPTYAHAPTPSSPTHVVGLVVEHGIGHAHIRPKHRGVAVIARLAPMVTQALAEYNASELVHE